MLPLLLALVTFTPAHPPTVFRTVTVGRMPAGAWLHEVFEADHGSPAKLVSQQPFVVSPLLPLIFTPAVPTSADVIRTTIEVPAGCSVSHATAVHGNVVRTTVSIRGCIVGPPPFPEYEEVALGPLPAGVYTYELYETYNDGPPYFIWQQPLVVNAVPVPTASTFALIAIATGIALAALLRTG